MRAGVASILTVAAILVVAGCGTTSMTTQSALEALRSAGFHGLVIHRNVGITESIDEIAQRKAGLRFFAPVRAVRFPSSAKAKAAFDDPHDSTYSRAGLRYVVYLHRHPKPTCSGCIATLMPLPRGFEIRKVLSRRICNVILFSYNARLDPELTAKVNRAAMLLRKKCH